MLPRYRCKFIGIMTFLLMLLVTIFIISIGTGFTPLSPGTLFRILIGQGTEVENLILFRFRMPRMVLSMLVGAGLAVSGCVFQAVTKNELAGPSLLGVNAGGGFAVLLFTFFASTTTPYGIFALPFVALIGATVSALLIFMISFRPGRTTSTFQLVLVGVAISSGINALGVIVTVRLSPEQFRVFNTWMIGSVWGSNWNFVLALLPWVCIIIPFLFMNAKTLNVLRLSDEVAIGLGASLGRQRFGFLMLAVALAAACVAISGAIGFVGLICPHIARKLISPTHQYTIPLSAIIGAVLLSGADLISRVVAQPREIPLGIVVAIIGAPYFLYLLMT